MHWKTFRTSGSEHLVFTEKSLPINKTDFIDSHHPPHAPQSEWLNANGLDRPGCNWTWTLVSDTIYIKTKTISSGENC